MTSFDIIPAIDILNGQLVRLTQGDYDKIENYDKTPVEMAQFYEDADVKRLHIVDLDGAKDGELINHHLLKDIRNSFSGKIEFGGGVRSIQTVQNLKRNWHRLHHIRVFTS